MEKSDSLKGLICDTRMLTLGTAHGFSALTLKYTQVLVGKAAHGPAGYVAVCVHMLKSPAGEMSLLPLTKTIGQHARVKRSKWGSPCWEGLSWMGCVKCHCACLGRFYNATAVWAEAIGDSFLSISVEQRVRYLARSRCNEYILSR